MKSVMNMTRMKSKISKKSSQAENMPLAGSGQEHEVQENTKKNQREI